MKKTIKYFLIALVIILLIILLVIFSSGPQSASLPQTNQLSTEAQVQSYAPEKVPSWEKDDFIFGSVDAPLKIFVYEDYSNIYSAQLADTLEKIRQEAGDKVAIIVRPYMIGDSVLSQNSALAMICAGENKWTKMRALLFSQIKNKQLVSKDFSLEIDQLKLNEKDFQACLTNLEKSERIEQVKKTAQQYGVLGAPTIFIGDEMILGARPYEDYIDSNGDTIEGLKTVVDRKLSN